MLEKLVSVATTGARAGVAAPEVEVDIRTNIPEPSVSFRLRLWDRQGRDPKKPDRNPGTTRWRLPEPQGGLSGCTLTWSVRLASATPTHFELSLQVLQGGVALPDGRFAYSGPLEGLEERAGRFHFSGRPSG